LMRNDPSGMGFDEKYIWKVAYEVLLGLKTLHENNIIHRDIKSANIFFVKGVAKLGDLNVSKITDNGFCSTQTGTPYYTSP
jgi:NIMA (never in mitosis gene a)-related kinase